jgi:hypothetical protein
VPQLPVNGLKTKGIVNINIFDYYSVATSTFTWHLNETTHPAGVENKPH